MKTKIIIIIVSLAMSIGLYFSIWDIKYQSYHGKILLDREQYEAFKLELANPEVILGEIQVMNSDPYLVQFGVTVPKNYNFTYGNTNNEIQIIETYFLVAVEIMFILITISVNLEEE